jgi:hypothetical protein
VLEPVGLNALLLTILGYCFPRFTRHAYGAAPKTSTPHYAISARI